MSELSIYVVINRRSVWKGRYIDEASSYRRLRSPVLAQYCGGTYGLKQPIFNWMSHVLLRKNRSWMEGAYRIFTAFPGTCAKRVESRP